MARLATVQLLFCVGSAAFAPPLRLRTHTAVSLRPRPCSTVRLSGNKDDQPSPEEIERKLQNISRELAKYDTKGLRIRQSGPVRKFTSGIGEFFSEAGALGRFLGGAAATVPFYGLSMVLLIAAYGLQQSAPRAAMVAGARMNAAILKGGQWHRLVSPVFLHGGGMHLFSNLFSTWRLGPFVEANFGWMRAALIYLLSGVGGNLSGLWFGSARGMSVGASGAVFGLIGAIGGYAMRNKRALGAYGDVLIQNAGQMLFLNLFIGMRRGSGIDNLAHIGGCATGALLGVLLSPSVRQSRGRWDGDPPEGDGTLVPPWAVRGLLAATLAAYAAGLYEATKIARAVVRIYGR